MEVWDEEGALRVGRVRALCIQAAVARAQSAAVRKVAQEACHRASQTRAEAMSRRRRRINDGPNPEAKVLPMQPGHAEQRTHDYVCHGTAALFAALEIGTGRVTGVCKNRHRHQEFLAFLKHVARAYPARGDGVELHLVMDNYATHKRVEVRDWLAANPRLHVHFTPTSGSWLNRVEVWFDIIERQAIRRGTFRSTCDLNAEIRDFINGWNNRRHPFIWTKTPDEILTKIERKKASPTRPLLVG